MPNPSVRPSRLRITGTDQVREIVYIVRLHYTQRLLRWTTKLQFCYGWVRGQQLSVLVCGTPGR